LVSCRRVVLAAAAAAVVAVARRWLRTRLGRWLLRSCASVFGTAALTALCVWLKRSLKYRSEGWKPITLDEFESTVGISSLPSVSATTFYKGGSLPSKALRERVRAVVEMNPWLAGRLHFLPGWMRAAASAPWFLRWAFYQAVLMVPPRSDVDSFLVELGDIGLRPDMPYDELMQKCNQHVSVMQPAGVVALLKEAPLFQVTLAPAGPDHFAMVVSLSHAIADGHTFYHIHGMLDANAEVRALDRVTSCLEAQDAAKEKTVGLHKYESYHDVRKLGLQGLRSLIRPKPKPAIYYVSTDWIAGEKQRAAKDTSGVGWVSTNDVLTSWFFNLSQCTTGFMCINFRNRVPGLTDVNAGNFEGLMPYWPEECNTPSKIRQSLNTFRTARDDTPGYLANFFGQCTGVTNWTTFYQPVNFPGSSLHSHIPTMDCSNLTWAIMVIFSPDSGSVGICVYARDPAVIKRVESSPAVRPWALGPEI